MKIRNFATAEPDAQGYLWSTDAEGTRYAVEPYADDEFTGYRTVDRRFVEDTPLGAGLPVDAWRWKSGDPVTNEQFAGLIGALNLPGRYVGVDGMTIPAYLSDPRAVVKVEDGRLIYRPELAQGDFESIDNESFVESLGALPFVLSAFAAPFAASLGAASLGGASLAAEEFITGMNSLVPGGSGVAEAIAASGAAASIPSGASLAAEEFITGMNSLVPGGSGVAEAIAASSTLTVPAAATVADVLKTTAGVVSSVATIAQASNILDAASSGSAPTLSPIGTQSTGNPLNLGALDMASKTASTGTPAATASTATPIDWQAIITVVVVAALAFAVVQELGD